MPMEFQMNAIPPDTTIPSIGEAFGGGFYAGDFMLNGHRHALIISPKAVGQSANKMTWGPYDDMTPGARSLDDGLANSESMRDESHPAAQFCRSLSIDGFDDWYLPSLDEMTLLRRNLMPRAGGNPEQTTAAAFQEDGSEAFDTGGWYWSSTEYSSGYAWVQNFLNGYQDLTVKGAACRVRAVRKCPL